MIKKIIINLKMFRGTAYTNRHIKKRDEDRSMDYHRFNLANVRPITGTIDNAEIVTLNNRKG